MATPSYAVVCALSSQTKPANSLSQVAMARTAFTKVQGMCMMLVPLEIVIVPPPENDFELTDATVLSMSMVSVIFAEDDGGNVSVVGETTALIPFPSTPVAFTL